MIAWSAAFYDALQRVDGNEILKQIGVFAALTLTSAVLYLIGRCLQQVLQIRWRTALTDEVLSRWLRNQTHWKLRLGGQGVDNPDQRIAEDCRLFAQLFITQGLGLVNELVAVASYFSVLWSLSTFGAFHSLVRSKRGNTKVHGLGRTAVCPAGEHVDALRWARRCES
ncbi:hypothetical protein BN2910_53420 [Achromobacter xylosoxidans]|nr:hypothetical protein BN2910_53420 [Achromobacter xylosoxidans]